MLLRRRNPLSRWVTAGLLSAASTPCLAFDDREFCAAIQQLAVAAERDVGLWIDRATRNAGIAVYCDRKLVEFKRFTYAPSTSMDQAWRERAAEQWNANHCSNPVWADAIRNDWRIALVTTAADGVQATTSAHCR